MGDGDGLVAREEGLRPLRLPDEVGEISAILECEDGAFLKGMGFDRALWAARDEGPVEDAIVLVGHAADPDRGPDEGWSVVELEAVPDAHAGETDDSETLARDGGWIYVLGSHFGSKEGPIEPERAFVARFSEGALDPGKTLEPALELVCRPFALHRAVNDALHRWDRAVVPLGLHVRRTFIEGTLQAAVDDGSPWAADVRVEDWPVNVEGALFEDDGSVVVGLRFPVSADGHPLLVRVRGIPELFRDADAPLEAEVIACLEEVGSRSRAAGVRGIHRGDDGIHVLTGPLGSVDKENRVAMDYPGSQLGPCEHWRLGEVGGGAPGAERIRVFDSQSVEGILHWDEHWVYSVDVEGEIVLLVEE